jgi:hypothetical protein
MPPVPRSLQARLCAHHTFDVTYFAAFPAHRVVMPHATCLVERTTWTRVGGHRHPVAREHLEGAIDAGSREAVTSGDQSVVDLVGASVTSQRNQGVVHSKSPSGCADPSFT